MARYLQLIGSLCFLSPVRIDEVEMVWSRKLPRPIYLNDGRTVGTLMAARDVMLSLPTTRLTSEHWRTAAELLLKAAYVGRLESIREAGAQVAHALEADRLV
jgi:hypothetical protein